MSERKSWGSTVLGWFVVKEDGAPEGASLPDEAAPPAAPEPPAFVKEPPAAPGGRVDFPKVYEAAGLDAEEQGRVAKAAELLAALPAGTEPAIKKQIVEASLKAFGVPIEKIIEGAVQEIQALEAYIRAGSLDTQNVHEESEKRIRQFEGEIARIKSVVESRTQEQLAVAAACNERKLGIQKVLEFFGQETVARVVRDSPKLVEPQGS
ncbi:MAG TPA: hypothetical protein VLJ18_10860 [Thermoanaerobaculia bacterium]|nr:hypothetical protein [Thermoanaerobaculia bacterium]